MNNLETLKNTVSGVNTITSVLLKSTRVYAGPFILLFLGELQLHRIDQLDDEPVSITASNVDIKNGFLSSLFMLRYGSFPFFCIFLLGLQYIQLQCPFNFYVVWTAVLH